MTRSTSLVGTQLGSFLLQERIAAGGFAVVYRAVQVTLGNRPTAVKVLKERADDSEEAREAFVNDFKAESALLARLDHENILPVIEAGEDRGHLYIAMRLVEGGSLQDFLRKYDEADEPVPLELLARFVRQIGAALDCAHEAGIVHRDVKPQNILLDRGLVCRLTDFGISRLMDATAKAHTTHVGGTPHYMSPEQWEAAPLTNRTDLYAVGVILFQMLTGKVPFDAPSTAAIISMHMSQEPVVPANPRHAIGRAMRAVIARALAKRPEDRFGSGAELSATAVDRAIRPTPARPSRNSRSRRNPGSTPIPRPPVPRGESAYSGPPASEPEPGVTRPSRDRGPGPVSVPEPAVVGARGGSSNRVVLTLAAGVALLCIGGFLWFIFGRAASLDEKQGIGKGPEDPAEVEDQGSSGGAAGRDGATEIHPDPPEIKLVSTRPVEAAWSIDRESLPVMLLWRDDPNRNLAVGQTKLRAGVEERLRRTYPVLRTRTARPEERDFARTIGSNPLALQAWFAANDVEALVFFDVDLQRHTSLQGRGDTKDVECLVTPAVFTRDDHLRATLTPAVRATESATSDPFGWTNRELPVLADDLGGRVDGELQRWRDEIEAKGRLVRIAIGEAEGRSLGSRDIVEVLRPLCPDGNDAVELDRAFTVSEPVLEVVGILRDLTLVEIFRRDSNWRIFRLRHKGDPGNVGILSQDGMASAEEGEAIPRLEKRANLIVFDRRSR
ncbi:MAG: protein kinase [Planctomycetota bacterium]